MKPARPRKRSPVAGVDAFEAIAGVAPGRVYQRSRDNFGTIRVTGRCASHIDGVVEARLVTAADQRDTPTWRTADGAARQFSIVLDDIPVGGPYRLELRVRAADRVLAGKRYDGLLVGDLWILAGQSNMEGCGALVDLEPPSSFVHAFYLGDTWDIARDPLCYFNEALEPAYWREPDPARRGAAIHLDRAFRQFGAGPAVRFGKDLYRATNVPVGLIVCPLGGSSMRQWDPALRTQGPASLYGALLQRVAGAGGRVAGCLWWQGESDTLEFECVEYRARMRDLVRNLRADLSAPTLPFLYVQLARLLEWESLTPPAGWNQVRNDQFRLEREIENAGFVAAIDATLCDPVHVDAVSQRRIGARLAKLARRMVFGHAIERGPRPASAAFVDDRRQRIRVRYTDVNGELTPRREIRGFTVDAADVPCEIRACTCQGSTDVDIELALPAPDGARLWYGRGLFPACNLGDQEGFTAPVFGPVAVPWTME